MDSFGAADSEQQQQQLSNMRPPHRVKEEFVRYVEASGFPRQLQKAMVTLHRAYTSGEMSASSATATEFVRERMQQARRRRIDRQQQMQQQHVQPPAHHEEEQQQQQPAAGPGADAAATPGGGDAAEGARGNPAAAPGPETR